MGEKIAFAPNLGSANNENPISVFVSDLYFALILTGSTSVFGENGGKNRPFFPLFSGANPHNRDDF